VDVQAIAARSDNQSSWSLERLFNTADKDTIIRLRWPLVILSSYLLYYSPSHWLTPTQVQSLLILYLLSHTTLYFLADRLFDSPYLYGPLLVFDTLVLLVVVEMGGTATPDFFVACLLTIVLSCICNDARGLLVVTLLAPLIYAYFVFSKAAAADPNTYLRLPFPFVISLFYGYFAQVERLRRAAREKSVQAKRQQKAAEELRCQRERLEVLHEINTALASTIDSAKILDAFLTRVLIHLPYAAVLVRLKNLATGQLEPASAQGFAPQRLSASKEAMELIDGCVAEQRAFAVSNVFADARFGNLELFKEEGLVALLALPLVANKEALGCLTFLTREEHQFGAEEIDFLSTLAGQAALSIHHAQLYERSRLQGDELRYAHKVKDRFLKNVSSDLKTPLNVITGYMDMFREGLLGELTPIQGKAIETVTRQARELQGLIGSVLLVTNLESEMMHVDLHEVNLWEFVTELRSGYDQPSAKHVSIRWDYSGELPTIQCDRSKLKHILQHLIENGVKFTDAGTVTIAIQYLSANQQLEIKITDTGVGIAPNEVPAIFERFRQGEHAEANVTRGGFGLGLYIVKKFLDALGGSIEVNSRLGKGSTFTIRIPAPLQAAKAGDDRLQT
jgi:signal transduction histidine kinase